MQESYDVVIIGAGPVGIAFSCALAHEGLKIALIDRLSEEVIKNPEPDGREIALTHQSMDFLKQLGAWQYIPSDSITPLKKAVVLNGESSSILGFDSEAVGKESLGYLVSNFKIRKALYHVLSSHPQINLYFNASVSNVVSTKQGVEVTFLNGETINAKLLVAADSRFSKTRQMMGIASKMVDFGRTMIVCGVSHEKNHEYTAYEYFFYGITLALLPMQGNYSSLVITLPSDQAAQLLAMKPNEFLSEISKKLLNRFGSLSLITQPISYPLVGVYADYFYAPSFALIGDAAVGMHPVTAHGFNLGLRSAMLLASKIKILNQSGKSFSSIDMLRRYHHEYKVISKPVYLLTNAIARLYAAENFSSKIVRNVGLRMMQQLSPLKKILLRRLVRVHQISG